MTSTKSKVWYVIYTRSRSEKKVLAELTAHGITCFVPLQKILRKWNDRKKLVEVPLLPGYCFVHINRVDYDRVLYNKNVISYVFFEGKAAIVPDNQIESLREMVEQSIYPVEVSFENFIPGQKVEIIVPPLTGLRGELVKTHGNNRFILRIESLGTNFMLDISADGIVYLMD